ncbi:MAG TPA: hypothetical protein VJJ75_01560 [Candidatus Nanoarchaeia archaeon]|nr:hypothetical protein [Candidatus Nanoarchaeia archaeon]
MLARSRTYWVADTGQEISAPGNYLIQTPVFSTATASTCPETTRGEITIQLVFRDKQGQILLSKGHKKDTYLKKPSPLFCYILEVVEPWFNKKRGDVNRRAFRLSLKVEEEEASPGCLLA